MSHNLVLSLLLVCGYAIGCVNASSLSDLIRERDDARVKYAPTHGRQLETNYQTWEDCGVTSDCMQQRAGWDGRLSVTPHDYGNNDAAIEANCIAKGCAGSSGDWYHCGGSWTGWYYPATAKWCGYWAHHHAPHHHSPHGHHPHGHHPHHHSPHGHNPHSHSPVTEQTINGWTTWTCPDASRRPWGSGVNCNTQSYTVPSSETWTECFRYGDDASFEQRCRQLTGNALGYRVGSAERESSPTAGDAYGRLKCFGWAGGWAVAVQCQHPYDQPAVSEIGHEQACESTPNWANLRSHCNTIGTILSEDWTKDCSGGYSTGYCLPYVVPSGKDASWTACYSDEHGALNYGGNAHTSIGAECTSRGNYVYRSTWEWCSRDGAGYKHMLGGLCEYIYGSAITMEGREAWECNDKGRLPSSSDPIYSCGTGYYTVPTTEDWTPCCNGCSEADYRNYCWNTYNKYYRYGSSEVDQTSISGNHGYGRFKCWGWAGGWSVSAKCHDTDFDNPTPNMHNMGSSNEKHYTACVSSGTQFEYGCPVGWTDMGVKAYNCQNSAYYSHECEDLHSNLDTPNDPNNRWVGCVSYGLFGEDQRDAWFKTECEKLGIAYKNNGVEGVDWAWCTHNLMNGRHYAQAKCTTAVGNDAWLDYTGAFWLPCVQETNTETRVQMWRDGCLTHAGHVYSEDYGDEYCDGYEGWFTGQCMPRKEYEKAGEPKCSTNDANKNDAVECWSSCHHNLQCNGDRNTCIRNECAQYSESYPMRSGARALTPLGSKDYTVQVPFTWFDGHGLWSWCSGCDALLGCKWVSGFCQRVAQPPAGEPPNGGIWSACISAEDDWQRWDAIAQDCISGANGNPAYLWTGSKAECHNDGVSAPYYEAGECAPPFASDNRGDYAYPVHSLDNGGLLACTDMAGMSKDQRKAQYRSLCRAKEGNSWYYSEGMKNAIGITAWEEYRCVTDSRYEYYTAECVQVKPKFEGNGWTNQCFHEYSLCPDLGGSTRDECILAMCQQQPNTAEGSPIWYSPDWTAENSIWAWCVGGDAYVQGKCHPRWTKPTRAGQNANTTSSADPESNWHWSECQSTSVDETQRDIEFVAKCAQYTNRLGEQRAWSGDWAWCGTEGSDSFVSAECIDPPQYKADDPQWTQCYSAGDSNIWSTDLWPRYRDYCATLTDIGGGCDSTILEDGGNACSPMTWWESGQNNKYWCGSGTESGRCEPVWMSPNYATAYGGDRVRSIPQLPGNYAAAQAVAKWTHRCYCDSSDLERDANFVEDCKQYGEGWIYAGDPYWTDCDNWVIHSCYAGLCINQHPVPTGLSSDSQYQVWAKCTYGTESQRDEQFRHYCENTTNWVEFEATVALLEDQYQRGPWTFHDTDKWAWCDIGSGLNKRWMTGRCEREWVFPSDSQLYNTGRQAAWGENCYSGSEASRDASMHADCVGVGKVWSGHWEKCDAWLITKWYAGECITLPECTSTLCTQAGTTWSACWYGLGNDATQDSNITRDCDSQTPAGSTNDLDPNYAIPLTFFGPVVPSWDKDKKYQQCDVSGWEAGLCEPLYEIPSESTLYYKDSHQGFWPHRCFKGSGGADREDQFMDYCKRMGVQEGVAEGYYYSGHWESCDNLMDGPDKHYIGECIKTRPSYTVNDEVWADCALDLGRGDRDDNLVKQSCEQKTRGYNTAAEEVPRLSYYTMGGTRADCDVSGWWTGKCGPAYTYPPPAELRFNNSATEFKANWTQKCYSGTETERDNALASDCAYLAPPSGSLPLIYSSHWECCRLPGDTLCTAGFYGAECIPVPIYIKDGYTYAHRSDTGDTFTDANGNVEYWSPCYQRDHQASITVAGVDYNQEMAIREYCHKYGMVWMETSDNCLSDGEWKTGRCLPKSEIEVVPGTTSNTYTTDIWSPCYHMRSTDLERGICSEPNDYDVCKNDFCSAITDQTTPMIWRDGGMLNVDRSYHFCGYGYSAGRCVPAYDLPTGDGPNGGTWTSQCYANTCNAVLDAAGHYHVRDRCIAIECSDMPGDMVVDDKWYCCSIPSTICTFEDHNAYYAGECIQRPATPSGGDTKCIHKEKEASCWRDKGACFQKECAKIQYNNANGEIEAKVWGGNVVACQSAGGQFESAVCETRPVPDPQNINECGDVESCTQCYTNNEQCAGLGDRFECIRADCFAQNMVYDGTARWCRRADGSYPDGHFGRVQFEAGRCTQVTTRPCPIMKLDGSCGEPVPVADGAPKLTTFCYAPDECLDGDVSNCLITECRDMSRSFNGYTQKCPKIYGFDTYAGWCAIKDRPDPPETGQLWTQCYQNEECYGNNRENCIKEECAKKFDGKNQSMIWDNNLGSRWRDCGNWYFQGECMEDPYPAPCALSKTLVFECYEEDPYCLMNSTEQVTIYPCGDRASCTWPKGELEALLKAQLQDESCSAEFEPLDYPIYNVNGKDYGCSLRTSATFVDPSNLWDTEEDVDTAGVVEHDLFPIPVPLCFPGFPAPSGNKFEHAQAMVGTASSITTMLDLYLPLLMNTTTEPLGTILQSVELLMGVMSPLMGSKKSRRLLKTEDHGDFYRNPWVPPYARWNHRELQETALLVSPNETITYPFGIQFGGLGADSVDKSIQRIYSELCSMDNATDMDSNCTRADQWNATAYNASLFLDSPKSYKENIKKCKELYEAIAKDNRENDHYVVKNIYSLGERAKKKALELVEAKNNAKEKIQVGDTPMDVKYQTQQHTATGAFEAVIASTRLKSGVARTSAETLAYKLGSDATGTDDGFITVLPLDSDADTYTDFASTEEDSLEVLVQNEEFDEAKKTLLVVDVDDVSEIANSPAITEGLAAKRQALGNVAQKILFFESIEGNTPLRDWATKNTLPENSEYAPNPDRSAKQTAIDVETFSDNKDAVQQAVSAAMNDPNAPHGPFYDSKVQHPYNDAAVVAAETRQQTADRLASTYTGDEASRTRDPSSPYAQTRTYAFGIRMGDGSESDTLGQGMQRIANSFNEPADACPGCAESWMRLADEEIVLSNHVASFLDENGNPPIEGSDQYTAFTEAQAVHKTHMTNFITATNTYEQACREARDPPPIEKRIVWSGDDGKDRASDLMHQKNQFLETVPAAGTSPDGNPIEYKTLDTTPVGAYLSLRDSGGSCVGCSVEERKGLRSVQDGFRSWTVSNICGDKFPCKIKTGTETVSAAQADATTYSSCLGAGGKWNTRKGQCGDIVRDVFQTFTADAQPGSAQSAYDANGNPKSPPGAFFNTLRGGTNHVANAGWKTASDGYAENAKDSIQRIADQKDRASDANRNEMKVVVNYAGDINNPGDVGNKIAVTQEIPIYAKHAAEIGVDLEVSVYSRNEEQTAALQSALESGTYTDANGNAQPIQATVSAGGDTSTTFQRTMEADRQRRINSLGDSANQYAGTRSYDFGPSYGLQGRGDSPNRLSVGDNGDTLGGALEKIGNELGADKTGPQGDKGRKWKELATVQIELNVALQEHHDPTIPVDTSKSAPNGANGYPYIDSQGNKVPSASAYDAFNTVYTERQSFILGQPDRHPAFDGLTEKNGEQITGFVHFTFDAENDIRDGLHPRPCEHHLLWSGSTGKNSARELMEGINEANQNTNFETREGSLSDGSPVVVKCLDQTSIGAWFNFQEGMECVKPCTTKDALNTKPTVDGFQSFLIESVCAKSGYPCTVGEKTYPDYESTKDANGVPKDAGDAGWYDSPSRAFVSGGGPHGWGEASRRYVEAARDDMRRMIDDGYPLKQYFVVDQPHKSGQELKDWISTRVAFDTEVPTFNNMVKELSPDATYDLEIYSGNPEASDAVKDIMETRSADKGGPITGATAVKKPEGSSAGGQIVANAPSAQAYQQSKKRSTQRSWGDFKFFIGELQGNEISQYAGGNLVNGTARANCAESALPLNNRGIYNPKDNYLIIAIQFPFTCGTPNAPGFMLGLRTYSIDNNVHFDVNFGINQGVFDCIASFLPPPVQAVLKALSVLGNIDWGFGISSASNFISRAIILKAPNFYSPDANGGITGWQERAFCSSFYTYVNVRLGGGVSNSLKKVAAAKEMLIESDISAYFKFNFGKVAGPMTKCASGSDSSKCRNGGVGQSLAMFEYVKLVQGRMQFNFADLTFGLLPTIEVTVEMREVLTFGGNSCADWIMDANFPNADMSPLAPGYYWSVLIGVELRGASWIDDICRSLKDAMSPADQSKCTSSTLTASARAGFYVSTVSIGFGIEFEVKDADDHRSGFGLQCHFGLGKNFGLWCQFGYSPPILLEPSNQRDDEYMITNPNCSGGPTECTIGASNMTFAQSNRASAANRRRLREEVPKKYAANGMEILKPLTKQQHERAQELLPYL